VDAEYDAQIAMAIQQNLITNRFYIRPNMAADPELQIAILESQAMNNQNEDAPRAHDLIGPKLNKNAMLRKPPISLMPRMNPGNMNNYTHVMSSEFNGNVMNNNGGMAVDSELDRIILEQVLEESKKNRNAKSVASSGVVFEKCWVAS